ncbi:MAG: glycoside hydrolase family 20 zincin-like fold domain-containing protein [Kiritimatiellae bacterium]|nr:glycoside hydrolase family 20 zincin-like fold domain-containing protein [Kiritimatiellia bacterium]
MKQSTFRKFTVIISLVLTTLFGGCFTTTTDKSSDDTKAWLRHIIPLPKEIEFVNFVSRNPAKVIVTTTSNATDVEQQAVALLNKALGKTSEQPAVRPKFEILLGTCSKDGMQGKRKIPGADKLAEKPNSDQAYVIAPISSKKLALTGLTERGVYYAAVTLAQLLEVKRTSSSVTIPLVRVIDWPDLSERGEWGGNASSDCEWMSSYKMNLAEVHANLKINDDGTGSASFKPELVEEGRLHAFKFVPIITHLEQLAPLGLFSKCPETRGIGPAAKLKGHAYCEVPCSSNPKYQTMLSQWMTDLARVKGVEVICVWLSENDLQCGCEQCKQIGEFAAETRACVKAWNEAKKVNPKLKLRLLLTQGSYKTNDKVLAEAPPEVQISYYDGGRTYDSSRDPMIYPLLDDFTKSGRWLGVYPQIISAWRVVCPWSSPQFVKYRMTEFVDKKLSNLCVYAPPHNRMYDFNVTAAAEWSWNAHGRDEREFAVAWATRRGVKDPEKAADWAVMLGPVSWDVYGSGVPYPAFFGSAGNMIRNRSKPILGKKGMYRYFPHEEHLQEDIETCDKALKLATNLDDPWIIAETKVVSGYVAMLSKLYNIATIISKKTPPTDAERQNISHDLLALAQAGVQVNEGLKAWEAASLDTKVGGRLADTMDITDQTVAQVSQALLLFGIRNPLAPYLSREIGQYHDNDFEEKQSFRKTMNVTSAISRPGTYQVKFTHTEGYNGATVSRVAIASAPKDNTNQLTEIVFDKHQGVIGYTPKDPIYSLPITTHDESLSYFVLADISGVKSSDKIAERRGCNGSITFWKVKQPGEEIKELPLLPMSNVKKAGK